MTCSNCQFAEKQHERDFYLGCKVAQHGQHASTVKSPNIAARMYSRLTLVTGDGTMLSARIMYTNLQRHRCHFIVTSYAVAEQLRLVVWHLLVLICHTGCVCYVWRPCKRAASRQHAKGNWPNR
jgi:hypothetical protein